MKKTILFFLCAILVALVSFFVGRATTSSSTQDVFQLIPTPTPTPLAKYSIEALRLAAITPASFVKGEPLKTTKEFESSTFSYFFDPTLSGGQIKKVSGVVNVPTTGGKHPLVVMVRGYVDPKIYTPGVGTKNAAEFFSKNGFITVAPDFLGYATSDSEAGNIFETRFQTYTTVMTLLDSIATHSFSDLVGNHWDGRNIFIWAHSNGGQVILSALSVTGLEYPTSLWAPVTKPFPYSVLYYTDESLDGGKLIRKELAKFEALYDVDKFSFTNYMQNIKAPIKFSQGTADDAVPFVWTRAISSSLKKMGLEIIYNEYSGSDHNLRPAWDSVVQSDLEFFNKHMKSEESPL